MSQVPPSSPTPPWRAAAWLVACGVALGAVWMLGGQESIGSRPVRAGILHIFLALTLFPLIAFFPWRKRAGLWILGLAALARILMLPMDTADDVHRYAWEGRVLQAGNNPYVTAPDDPALAPIRDRHWDKINNKHMTAIYPPGSLLLFRTLAAVTSDPAGYKLFLTLVDFCCVALLLSLLRHYGRKPAWALLYALNPIVLLSFAGEGHLDALLVFFMLLALLCHARKWFPAMFACLALAIHAKYMAVLLVPFLINRSTWRFAWVLPAAVILPSLAFWPLDGLFTSLTEFSTDMHYNGSIHALLGLTLGSFPIASQLSCALLIGWIGCVFGITRRPMEAGALVLSGLLLLAPTMHFWYLTWVIPFLCFYPLRPMLILCVTIALMFQTQGTMLQTGEWKHYPWLVLLEYVPVYGVLLHAVLRRRFVPAPLADDVPRQKLHNLSVIVPVLNEEKMMPRLIGQMRSLNGFATEVILCDGGSTDETVPLAAGAGFRVVRCPPGRGTQNRAGIDAASGDAILLAHADMLIEPDTPECILTALNHSGADGGSVGCRFEDPSLFLRCIGALNTLRAKVFGVSFGDQGQFFRVDALNAAGGYPQLPIMEDVEFSMRLKRRSRPIFLGGGLVVSSRGWRKRGNWRNAALVLRLCATYSWRRLLGRERPDVSDLYEAYYGSPAQPVHPQETGKDAPSGGSELDAGSAAGVH